MRIKLFNRRRESGDTIVEVLIAIAVISVVMVGAYALSGRSTSTVQDTQERSQAQQYLQSQVEMFRAYLAKGNAAPTGTAVPMCVKNSMTLINDVEHDSATANCNPTSTGGAVYKMEFERVDDSSLTYRFTIRWDAMGGGVSQLSHVYRVAGSSGAPVVAPAVPATPGGGGGATPAGQPVDDGSVRCPVDSFPYMNMCYDEFEGPRWAGECPPYAPYDYAGICYYQLEPLDG